MDLKIVFNLIVHYFLNTNIRYLNVLNCWKFEDQLNFLKLSSSKTILTRFIRLDLNNLETVCRYDRLQRDGFVLDLFCANASVTLMQLSELKCFTSKNYWIIYESETPRSVGPYEIFQEMNFNIDTHLTYAKLSNSSSVFELFDVYNNGKQLGGQLNVTFDRELDCIRAPCSTKTINTKLSERKLYANRLLMSDLTLRVASVITFIDINQPHEILMRYLNSIENPYMDNIPRYGYRLIILLQEILHYNITWLHRSKWTANYTAGGVLGDLKSNLIEQSISPFILDLPRLKDVSIVFIPSNFRTMFIFRTTENEGLIGSSFAKPFQLGVWLCLIGFVFILSVFLKIVFNIERKLGDSIEFIPSYLLTILNTFGSFCQQSSSVIPRSLGGRIAYVFLLITCFILYNYYTSIIVSFLLGSPIPSSIKTLREFSDSKLEVGIEDTAYTRTYMNSQQPGIEYFVQKKIQTLKNPQSLWMKSDEGISKTRNPGFAYHCDSNVAYFFVDKFFEPYEICDLNEIDFQARKFLGFLTEKGSPYKEIYRLKFFWMLETGMVSKHHRYWFKRKPPCLANNVIKSVEFEYVAPLFIVLGIGVCVSLLVFLLEIKF